MISLKSLLKTVKAAKITQPKEGVDTPLDARIQVEGYGVMKVKEEKKVTKKHILREMYERIGGK